MIIVEGGEFSLSPVWARGGQAPLRAQTSVLTDCSSADLSLCLALPVFGAFGARRAGPSPVSRRGVPVLAFLRLPFAPPSPRARGRRPERQAAVAAWYWRAVTGVECGDRGPGFSRREGKSSSFGGRGGAFWVRGRRPGPPHPSG